MSEYPQQEYVKPNREEPVTLTESLKALQFKVEALFELRSSSQLLVEKLNRTVDLPRESTGLAGIPEPRKDANIVQLFNEATFLIEAISNDIHEDIMKASRMID